MNKAVNSKQLLSISRLAWAVYEQCRDSSQEFQRISNDVKLMHANLNEVQILLEEYQYDLSPKRREDLETILKHCVDSLDELDKHVKKYESLATPSQKVFDQLRYGLKDVSSIKDEITRTTTQLAALNISLSRSSNRFLFKRCGKYLDEVRGGLHEGSVVTTATEENVDDDEFLDGLFRELENVGITRSALNESKGIIKAYFRDKWLRGELEEQPPTQDFTSMTSDTTAIDDRSEAPQPDAATEPIVFDNPFANVDTAPTVGTSRNFTMRTSTSFASTITPIKRRKSRIGSALNKILGLDAGLLEAASDGDTEKVAELIKRGADINVKDKWAWAPMSMAAYGGYPEIAQLLMNAGADLDYEDVDGDTPLSLAESKGHTDVVLLIQEEMTKRAIDQG